MLVHIEVESIIETVPCWNQSGIAWGDWEKYEILLPSFFRLPGFTVGGDPREMERDGRQEKKRRNVGETVERNAQQFLIFQRAKRSEPKKEGREPGVQGTEGGSEVGKYFLNYHLFSALRS